MANVEDPDWPPIMSYAVAGVLLLCFGLSALVIAGSRSTREGVAIVVVTAVLGLLYGVLAVWSDERAQREREARGRDD